jgi:hypothetical protein
VNAALATTPLHDVLRRFDFTPVTLTIVERQAQTGPSPGLALAGQQDKRVQSTGQ